MKKPLLFILLLLLVGVAFADVYPIGTLGTSSSATSGPFSGLYDFGWTKTIVTSAEMIGTLEKVTGLCAQREQLPFQDGEVMHTRADISTAKALLGYEPQVAFEVGLARFWEWMREQGS